MHYCLLSPGLGRRAAVAPVLVKRTTTNRREPGFPTVSRCQKLESTGHLTSTQAFLFLKPMPPFFRFCGQVVIFYLEDSVRLPRVASESALSDFALENTH